MRDTLVNRVPLARVFIMKTIPFFTRPSFSFLQLGLPLMGILVFSGCESLPEVLTDPPVAGDGDGDGDMGGHNGDGDLVVPGDGDGDGDMGGATSYVCGDGSLDPGELCDDGGTDDGDGCSGDCQEQDPDYDCSTPGETCRNTVVCGNGVIEGDELCDEGSGNATKGCSKDCSDITDGWTCPRPGRECVELATCGNGVRERGEQCDDAQDPPEDGDGCSAACQEEDPSSYFCVPGALCLELDCGDGIRTPDEACDDGNGVVEDGCTACTVDEGYRCSSSGCATICGDGLIRGSEECDDTNRDSGDGCSAACTEEPYQNCTGEPSACVTTIECGNNVVEPGEICDPLPADVATTDCVLTGSNACKAFNNGLVDVADCGNGVVELGEECDGDGGTGGCDNNCQVEAGYACPGAGVCYLVPACGDNIVQAGEECDVGAMTSLACDNCVVQPDWYCSGSPSTCVVSDCGDGIVAPDEQCDDGDGGGDGCNGSCQVESGWVCPPGASCRPRCGDGVLKGTEKCDITSPGCINCQVQPGYDCGLDGVTACVASVCGNGIQENGEGCDDGGRCSNNIALACTKDADCGAGTCREIAGDGCGPTCQKEPVVTVGPNPVVTTTCGDGLRTGSEKNAGRCDDGNNTPGDGCNATCNVETGYACTDQLNLPGAVDLKIKYRDFKDRSVTGGHPHMRTSGSSNVTYPQGTDKQITGAVCYYNSAGDNNVDTCGRLDVGGKPLLDSTEADATIYANSGSATSAQAFGLWYRDTNANGYVGPNGAIEIGNMGENDFLTLSQTGGANGTSYVFDSVGNNFYPLDGRGFGATPVPVTPAHNWHFTSEIRYFFQYQVGQELQFYGDDDVWVYVNGRLAVDIGGIHGQENGRVVLGDENTSCSVTSTATCTLSAGELADTTDDRFGITVGNLYEIVIFQAERHPTGSNYKLTLNGFIAPRSSCQTNCGDGIVAGNELCDDGSDPTTGNKNGIYNKCNTSCTYTFCGDGIKQSQEVCDNGLNVDTYDDGGANLCAPGCVAPGNCGDGILQPSDEVCDDGDNDGGYGECDSCTSISYCGDGIISGPEVCEKDNKDRNNVANPGEKFVSYRQGANDCGFNCQLAPFCGDNVRNGPEHCEPSLSSGCSSSCTFTPFCGDGLLDSGTGEECDYGIFATPAAQETPYGGCNDLCENGPYCGDGEQHDYEECDEGPDGNDGEYDSCTGNCTLGPRCGDAAVQSVQGEECDNGFNDDVYAYSEDSCGEGCKAVPSCGDGKLEATFELCDNGEDNDDDKYDGCTLSCDWGPYCGDGIRQNSFEACDLGAKNSSYSANGKGCGYDCQPAPYCGDGERNGPEKCDLGTADNDGDYGTCNPDCTLAPFCGDRIVQKSAGESCDDGPTGSLSCSVTCVKRQVIK